MNINKDLDKFMLATLWLWLPFHAFFALIKELMERLDKK